MKAGRSSAQHSAGAAALRAAVATAEAAVATLAAVQAPAWLGQQALRGTGCSARGRLTLHHTENCFSLC